MAGNRQGNDLLTLVAPSSRVDHRNRHHTGRAAGLKLSEAARECERRKRAKEFHIGDEAKITSKWGKSQAFPEGTVHQYAAEGHSGIVVGLVGREVVVRGWGDIQQPVRPTPPPGEAYYDMWAPRQDVEIVKCGKGPPAEAWAMPPRRIARKSEDDIESILQSWADKKGLGPMPSYDVEKFMKGTGFVKD